MAGYVCIGALAAFGLLSIGWCLLGWILHTGRGSVLLVLGEEGLERLLWLRSLGLIQSRLALPLGQRSAEEALRLREQGIELWSREEIMARQEMGAETN